MQIPAWRIGIFLAALLLGAVTTARAQQSKPPAQTKGVLDIVVTDEAGERLVGAAVAVPGYRSTTGQKGTCSFGLMPGRYSVLVTKTGYHPRRVTAGVRPNETTTTQVQLQKLAPARPPRK